MPRKNKDKNILVTRLSAIGDVAMTIPALYSACRQNPDARFVMLTRPAMARMMLNPPSNLTVHAVEPSQKPYRGIRGIARLTRELHDAYGPFTAVADLHNVIRTRIISALIRLRGAETARLVKDRRGRRRLTRPNRKQMAEQRQQTARYADTFRALGLRCDTSSFAGLFPPTGKAPTGSFAAVTGPKPRGERWIGIAPFARYQGKIYPPEQMAEVVRALAADSNNRIFLFGGGDDERAVLSRWTAPNVVSMADARHGFAVELALMSHFDAMIAMDSANMHLAALAGVPTVSVWGATHPYCGFRAFGQTDADAIGLDLPCRPCSVYGKTPCRRGDYACMTGIAPQLIVNQVNSIINRGL